MFYPKNVPTIERALRIIVGIGLVAFAIFGQTRIAGFSPLITGLVIFSALGLVVTGFIGWCPACAMIGRKIKSHEKQS